MVHFILVVVFFSGSGMGKADVGTINGIEFENVHACEVARAVVNQHMNKRAIDQTELVCVPKG